MAKDKKSFLLYCDLIHTFEELDDDEAGRLIKHIFRYVNDLNPQAPDKITKIAFEPIKQQLKRDLTKWEMELENKSIGGRIGNLKRWNKDLYFQLIDKKITIEEAENIARHRIPSHTDTVPSHPIAPIAVSVSETVTVIEDKEKKTLLSEIKISDDTDFFTKTAFHFQKLFLKNIQELGVKNSTIQNANAHKWITHIRLCVEVDKRTPAEFREVYTFLEREKIEDKFCWKKNILSTEKLREQFEKLLIAAKTNVNHATTNTRRISGKNHATDRL
jgi:hypothetical protein